MARVRREHKEEARLPCRGAWESGGARARGRWRGFPKKAISGRRASNERRVVKRIEEGRIKPGKIREYREMGGVR